MGDDEFGANSMWSLGVVCGESNSEKGEAKCFTNGQAVETQNGNLAFVCGAAGFSNPDRLWIYINEFTNAGVKFDIVCSSTLKILEDQARYAGYARPEGYAHEGSAPKNVRFVKDGNGDFSMVVKCAWAPGI